ncbi:uncharacterized protein A4U43_C04F24450 [Asparagus officinalis]|uniref:Uncharacterized protein n=1 Tax=Asparagus officinalis TaxID=4686 RepID=A0A5P1F3C1_ASPOF|nr:uncharacterized protein A4U43_C04F24450 [Asparagus officinalis]
MRGVAMRLQKGLNEGSSNAATYASEDSMCAFDSEVEGALGSDVEELHEIRRMNKDKQLYLAGNQITSLSVFLNFLIWRLKSLAMASQPRLQVLAASKNKISTLKGFPHLSVLEVSFVAVYFYFNMGAGILCLSSPQLAKYLSFSHVLLLILPYELKTVETVFSFIDSQ